MKRGRRRREREREGKESSAASVDRAYFANLQPAREGSASFNSRGRTTSRLH